MIEIERKFRVNADQKTKIKALLVDKYGKLTQLHQIDEVFLYGIDSFKEFKAGMPVMRLRTQNGETQLAYKHRINDAGDSVEHELLVSSAETMRQILREMDYHSVTLVEKIRWEVKVGNSAIMVDEVKNLGDFVEIEIVAEDDSQLGQLERQIMATASELGLDAGDIETKKYDQLVAHKSSN